MCYRSDKLLNLYSTDIYLLKVKIGNAGATCEICSKLIMTLMTSSGVFIVNFAYFDSVNYFVDYIVNFEQLCLYLVSLLLTFNNCVFIWCLYCQLWTDFIHCLVAIIVNFEQVNVGCVLSELFLSTFSIIRSPSICFCISWIWTTISLLKFHKPDTHPAIKWADASTKATAFSFSIFLFYQLIPLALVKKPHPLTSYHH